VFSELSRREKSVKDERLFFKRRNNVKDDLPSYEIFRSLMGNDYIFVVENSDKTRRFLFFRFTEF